MTGRKLTSVYGFLDYASNTGYRGLGRLIPELVDELAAEIYDVKSWDETLDGMIKIQDYVVAFNQADPLPDSAMKWHAGLTYNYAGANPVRLQGKSNGKAVCARYFPTEAGVIPYKLYEVDDDKDMERIPVTVPLLVKERRPEAEYRIYVQPVGQTIYADYYSRRMAL